MEIRTVYIEFICNVCYQPDLYEMWPLYSFVLYTDWWVKVINSHLPFHKKVADYFIGIISSVGINYQI